MKNAHPFYRGWCRVYTVDTFCWNWHWRWCILFTLPAFECIFSSFPCNDFWWAVLIAEHTACSSWSRKKTHTHRTNWNSFCAFLFFWNFIWNRFFFNFIFLSWKKKQRAAVRMHRNHYIIMWSPYTTEKKKISAQKLLFFISMRKRERRM